MSVNPNVLEASRDSMLGIEGRELTCGANVCLIGSATIADSTLVVVRCVGKPLWTGVKGALYEHGFIAPCILPWRQQLRLAYGHIQSLKRQRTSSPKETRRNERLQTTRAACDCVYPAQQPPVLRCQLNHRHYPSATTCNQFAGVQVRVSKPQSNADPTVWHFVLNTQNDFAKKRSFNSFDKALQSDASD